MANDLDEQKRQLEAKLKMHAASMGGNVRLPRKSKKTSVQSEPSQPKTPPKEIQKTPEKKEPTETQYELTEKAIEMADKLMAAKGVENMMTNPIMSSTIKPRNDIAMNPKNTMDSGQEKTNSVGKKRQSSVKKVVSNKDPDFSSVSPNSIRPIKVNDTIADILGKMYNLMLFKYHYDDKKYKSDKKYRTSLEKLREKHIEELIGLFGGRYKKTKAKAEKTETEKSKKEEESFFSKALGAVKSGINKIKNSVDKSLGSFKKPATQAAAQIAKPGVSTAIKIAAGSAGVLTGAAALSATLEVGYGTKNDLGPGAIVKDSGGGYSYGYFGINSKGDDRSPIASFVREYPQFGLKSKPGTKEFNEEWKNIAATRREELTQAQQDWYNRHVLSTVISDYAKILPTSIISDERVQSYLADRRNQYGNTYDKPGIIASKDAKSPEEFIKRLSAYDISHIEQNFPTALSTEAAKGPGKKEQFKVGLENRVKRRESGSLKTTVSPKSPAISPPSSVNIPPAPKQLNNQSAPSSSEISVLNNTTNIANGGTTYVTEEEKNYRPALIEKTYYG